MTEVLKAPKPSPAKTDSCNPFHNRTQDRTKERENWTVLDLGISKDREWAAKAPRVGLLNTYCAGKRPRTGWSTRLSILKKTLRDATLRLCQRSQLTLPPLNRPTWLTTRSSNDRWEVAADIQTGEQYSSTGSINAQKRLATIQWHLEKHSLSSSRCQPSSRQRQQLLWLAFQMTTWSQQWHPKSSTPRPSPPQNHQSTSQGTKELSGEGKLSCFLVGFIFRLRSEESRMFQLFIIALPHSILYIMLRKNIVLEWEIKCS